MPRLEPGRLLRLLAVMASLSAACGDSEDTSKNNGNAQGDGDAPGDGDGDITVGDGDVTVGDGDVTAGDGDDAGPAPGPSYPVLSSAFSSSGCTDLGVPALCSLKQEGAALTANCGGTLYTGTVNEARDITLQATQASTAEGAAVTISCSGKVQASGAFGANCTQTTTPTVGAATTATCTLNADPRILPDVLCLDLPSELSSVVICKEGAAQEGTTIQAGSCKVVQDGCVFQADCANNVVLTGSVSTTGISFTQRLKALKDAQTPTSGTPPVAGTPAFLKGAEVNHACTATIEGTNVTGSCGAGAAGRSGVNTSVCAVEGQAVARPTCQLLAPSSEELFALESCDLLKDGENGAGGIGEPVCAIRQRNCIWDIQCGNDPSTKFSGRLEAGATSASWKLATGTPCSVSFNQTGKLTGSCTVPGEAPCQLSSKPAVAGGAECPTLPAGVNFYSNGCAGGDPLDCRKMVQHGCKFMAACDFSSRFQGVLIAGESSYVETDRPRLDFNGMSGYTCNVQKSTAAEVSSGDRAANEWYGDCTNAAGGGCRNTYDPVTKTGFRKLRVYFE